MLSNGDCDVVFGDGRLPGEAPLHAQLYRSRPDINAVVHTHAVNSILFSLSGLPLRPIGRQSSIFPKGVGVYPSSAFIDTPQRAAALGEALGVDSAILLRNHGLVAVGPTIEVATFVAVSLERACALNLRAAAVLRCTDEFWDDELQEESAGRVLANAEPVFRYLIRNYVGGFNSS